MPPRIGTRGTPAVAAWSVALLVAGAVAFSRLPLELVPSLELSALVVNATWPGASPTVVERNVLQPIEESLQGLRGTEEVASYASAGQGTIELRVARSQDLGSYASELGDRLSSLRNALPPGVHPQIDRVVPADLRQDDGFMTLDLSGPAISSQLRRLAEDMVQPRLRSVPGISSVRIDGGANQELRIQLRADRMRAYGLDADGIASTLRAALSEQHYGWLGVGRSALLYSPTVDSLSTLRRLPLVQHRTAVATLDDVARVDLRAMDVASASRVDGEPAISLTVEREPGSNLLRTAGRVRAALPRIRTALGDSVRLRVAVDQSQRVRAELTDLAWRGALGWLCIAVALGLMLVRGRAVALVLLNAAVAMAFGVLLMAPLGLTLNLLTMAGLALLVGLVVDNATVIVEGYVAARSDEPAERFREAFANWIPLVGSTVSTVAVFVPLVYLSGDLKGLFAPFAVLGAATLIFSLVSARILLPPLASWWLPPTRRVSAYGSRLRRLLLMPYRFAMGYRLVLWVVLFLLIGVPWPWIPWSTQHSSATARAQALDESGAQIGGDAAQRMLERVTGGVTARFLSSVQLGRGWRFDRAPEIQLRLELPPGSGRVRTDAVLTPFERMASESGAARRVLSRIEGDRALLRVVFEDRDLAGPAPFDLRTDLIERALSLAGVRITITGLLPLGYYGGYGLVHGYLIEATGADADVLDRLVLQLTTTLKRHPRIADVDSHASAIGSWTARPSLRLSWDHRAAKITGWSARHLASVLSPLLPRDAPTFYASFADDPMVPVRLETVGSPTLDIRQLVHDSTVAPVPSVWRHLIGVATEPQAPVIERHDQQYIRYLRAYYRGPDRAGQKLVDRVLAGQQLPPGYALRRPDPTFFSAAVTREFILLLAGAVVLIFLTLAAVLEDWRHGAMALIGIPCAWVGIAFVFLATGAPFAEGAFLGILLVFGIAVNDAVLLIHRWAILRRRHRHRSAPGLALVALAQRLRPMWATTLTSICGMLPLLLLPGASPFWQAFALTVVGGVLASSLLPPALLLSVFAGSEP